MQQVVAPVVSVDVYDALPAFHRVRLSAPALVASMKPGQFLLVDTEVEYVRLPFFPIAFQGDDLTLLLPTGSPLRRLGPGDSLDCIGPLGSGFPPAPSAPNLLLLAQCHGFGVSHQQNGVSFLLTLINQALAAARNVLLIHEAPTAAQLFPPACLPPGVEVRLATLDGSQGQAGAALDLISDVAQWADQVCAVGTPEWYRALLQVLRDHRLRVSKGLACGLLAPEVMPCGMGVCGGCVIETGRGYRNPCVDGPVFDLSKL
jgi:dihydroorotate dehydrogenase electron transfer subunit